MIKSLKKIIKERINKRKQKKGFTLVELLAVIVILAIIMVITIPTVLGNMNKAKQSAFNTVGETMIKYLEDNYKNCKIGNKNLAKFDEEIFEDNCDLKGNISEKLIINSGYSKNDIDRVEISKLDSGNFGVVVYPKSEGKFDGIETFIQGRYEGECWIIEPINKEEYKLVKFNAFISEFDEDEWQNHFEKCGFNGFDWENGEPQGEVTLTIPSKVDGKKITMLGNSLFTFEESEDMDEIFEIVNGVIIEEGITTIEDGVFLEQLGLLADGTGAFTNFITKRENLENLELNFTLPDSLEYIGDYAFYAFPNISHFKINIELPSNLKIIGKYAFVANMINKNKLVIPSSVIEIGESAFILYGSYKKIEFVGAEDGTSKLKSIGYRAFNGVGDLVTKNENFFNLIYDGTTEDNYLQLPSSVKEIGNDAFSNHTNLKYIRFNGTREQLDKLGTGWYDAGVTVKTLGE